MGKTKSIITEYENICFFCGRPAEGEHHLVFGNGRRKLAEEDGLKVPACNQCHTLGTVTGRIHDNVMAEKMSKMLGQAIFELEVGDRQDFMSRYKKSYL